MKNIIEKYKFYSDSKNINDKNSSYLSYRVFNLIDKLKNKGFNHNDLIAKVLILYLRNEKIKNGYEGYEVVTNKALKIIEETNSVHDLVKVIEKSNIDNIRFAKYLEELDRDKIVHDGKVNEIWANVLFSNLTSNCFSLNQFADGKYRISITHRNSEVFKNRKALILYFGALPEYIRKEKGLALSADSQAFTYMGSGIKKDGVYNQDFYIDVDEKIKNIVLYFATTIEDFKIETLSIQNCALKTVNEKQVKNDLIDNSSSINLHNLDANDIEYILYADINANVVDGSSVWYSSMASILAAQGKTALIIKENLRHDQVISNIEHNHNIELITPEKIGYNGVIDIETGVDLVRKIDNISPNVRAVVVRGCEVAYQLSQTRQFYNRLASYITDFYTVDNNELIINDEKVEKLKLISLRSVYILVQTKAIKDKIEELTNNKSKYILIPPPINDKFLDSTKSSSLSPLANSDVNDSQVQRAVKIGYAGKITPGWGIFELFEFVERLKGEGKEVKLYIAANKISSPTNLKEFRQTIQNWFKKLDVNYYNDLNREQSLEMLSGMDFIWCFRPADFETATLELSTKLVESVAIGGRCLCYPSEININSLGKDYPFFIKSYQDFRKVLGKKTLSLDPKFSKKIWQKHSLKNITNEFHSHFASIPLSNKKMLFAGHDFKFIDAYISYLKSRRVPVKKEIWEWGGHKNQKQLIANYKWADMVFCEWGLANAVWYSKHNSDNKPIYIRMHAQEVRERAQKFGRQIDTNNITKIIFVSENIRRQAIEIFKYDINKTKYIPNFVMDDEFYFSQRDLKKKSVVLGVLGIVPKTKRLDRAVLLLDSLRKSGVDAYLNIKGYRPEELEFMRAPSRTKELDYYYETYKLIETLGLSDYVTFEGWGADVRDWYEKIDVILSPSENESFHYALADGVLSGCLPVVWNWPEADAIYPNEWVVSNNSDARQKVESYIRHHKVICITKSNREYLISKFGSKKIFNLLSDSIL
ncbi:glycosyltransferase [Psychrobacter sp. F1192]|uniref:Glycosyltransferase n=1 Tax=Psychrobacter coccoides TaxID=2818440 RepID=A0ABS3NLX5_9GAMM|nr:glycosyltransferase [Psychrobacter coccoides]MBO1530417.1 glycosyltransferase [Psychrobacter coccoides]